MITRGTPHEQHDYTKMRTIVLEYIYLQNCAIVGVKFQHHGASSWIITCRIQPQAPGWHLMAPGGSWRHAAAKLKWSWGKRISTYHVVHVVLIFGRPQEMNLVYKVMPQ